MYDYGLKRMGQFMSFGCFQHPKQHAGPGEFVYHKTVATEKEENIWP